MPKPKLKAVQPDIKPQRSKKKKSDTVTSAAQNGTQEDLLIALRDRIAKSIDDPATPARDLTSLSKRILDVNKELSLIQSAKKEEQEALEHDTGDENWEAI